MNPLNTIWRWLRSLGQTKAMKQEIDEELRFHIEQRTAENITAGMSAEAAAREARKRFGNSQSVREECRDVRGASFGEETWRDIRFGLRMLHKNPGFTTVAVLTLALGIGANTAIFSVINGVLLNPLPYDHPGQLVNLREAPPQGSQMIVSGGAFTDWRENSASFDVMSVVRGIEMNLTGEGEPERISGLQVSASYLQALRLQPELGRGFSSEEDKPGGDNKVIVIGHGLWHRRFGADRNVVGRTIRLDGQTHTVLGVLPPNATLVGQERGDPQFLIPFVFGTEIWHTTRASHSFKVIARLKSTVTIKEAQVELTGIKRRLQPLYPKWKENWGVMVVPLHEYVTGKVKPTLLVLMGAVGFVLLIACANVANLLLAKAASRQKEMAIRTALGASRWRVMRQVLTESSLLALLGGLLGIGLGYWGVQMLSQWSGATLPRVGEIALDLRVLVFSLLASVGTGLLFGLVPALRVSAPNLNLTLKEGGRGSTRGSQNRVRVGLIVAELGLAVMLLTGAGLLLRSFFRLLNVDPGFNRRNTLALDVSLPDAKYRSGEDQARFFRQIFESLEALPGVEAAGMASSLPMQGSSYDSAVRVPGRENQPEPGYNARFDFVAGNYFRALGIPFVKGRDFSPRDNSTNAPRVVVFNEALVKKIFPNEDAVGRRIGFWGAEWEIVGVVRSVRQNRLDDDRMDRLYLPQAFFWGSGSLVVRTKGSPLALADSIRKQILALDPDQSVSNIRTMEQAISGSLSARRLTLTLLGLFAALALGLAVIGLYGVMAYTVAQRAHEIGIRMALGAQRTDVLRLILRHGLALTSLGVALGLIGALALTRVLRSHLYEVGTTDPGTFIAVSLLLVVVALLACLIPARRAAKVDPMVALRHE